MRRFRAMTIRWKGFKEDLADLPDEMALIEGVRLIRLVCCQVVIDFELRLRSEI